MKKIFLTAMMTTALLATSTTFAEGKNHRFGKQYDSRAQLYKKLDLSDEQQKAIKDIFRNSRKKDDKTDDFKQRQLMMQQRQTLIEAPTFDENAAIAIAKEKAEQMQSGFVRRLRAEHQAWQLLTPKQQAKAKELMEKQQKKRQKRMKKRQACQSKRRLCKTC